MHIFQTLYNSIIGHYTVKANQSHTYWHFTLESVTFKWVFGTNDSTSGEGFLPYGRPYHTIWHCLCNLMHSDLAATQLSWHAELYHVVTHTTFCKNQDETGAWWEIVLSFTRTSFISDLRVPTIILPPSHLMSLTKALNKLIVSAIPVVLHKMDQSSVFLSAMVVPFSKMNNLNVLITVTEGLVYHPSKWSQWQSWWKGITYSTHHLPPLGG